MKNSTRYAFGWPTLRSLTYPFRWDIVASTSHVNDHAQTWTDFEAAWSQAAAAVEVNVGCGCSDKKVENHLILLEKRLPKPELPGEQSKIGHGKLYNKKSDGKSKPVEETGIFTFVGPRTRYEGQCYLSPVFEPTIYNYTMSCFNPGSAYLSFSSVHDVLINGHLWHPGARVPGAYWDIPVEAFTTLPSILHLDTLLHASVGKCKTTKDCVSPHAPPGTHLCVMQLGECRQVARKVTVRVEHRVELIKMSEFEALAGTYLKQLSVLGSCQLAPAFSMSIYQYVSMCAHAEAESVVVEARVDNSTEILINDMVLAGPGRLVRSVTAW